MLLPAACARAPLALGWTSVAPSQPLCMRLDGHQGAMSRREMLADLALRIGAAAAVVLPTAPAAGVADEIPSWKADVWADLDGAVGITWGGRDRCAPEDEACRDNGQAVESVKVLPPPKVEDFNVSDKCYLDIAIAGKPAGRITVGLWAAAAPASVGVFKKLCQGDLMIGASETVGPFSYTASSVESVSRDRSIVLGNVKSPAGLGREARQAQFAPERNVDSNDLRHDAAGLLSVKRGGATFNFVLTPGPNRGLDRDNIVIGQVLDGMGILARMNEMPVNKYDGSPLRKITVVDAGLL